MCPDHKIGQKLYSVESKIDEDAEEIISVDCHDCTASDGMNNKPKNFLHLFTDFCNE